MRNTLIEPPTVYPTPTQKVAQDLPSVQLPAKYKDYKSYLRALAGEGAVQRYGCPLPEAVKVTNKVHRLCLSFNNLVSFLLTSN